MDEKTPMSDVITTLDTLSLMDGQDRNKVENILSETDDDHDR